MSDAAVIPSWMRGRPPQSAAKPDLSKPAVGVRAVTLAERFEPFLRECDDALADAARLRDDNGSLVNEVRYLNKMITEQSARIDDLSRENAVAIAEASLLRARMKMFGEAASAIIAEASKEARDAYAPKTPVVVVPAPQAPPAPPQEPPRTLDTVRPVKEIAPSQEDDEVGDAIARLVRMPTFGAGVPAFGSGGRK